MTTAFHLLSPRMQGFLAAEGFTRPTAAQEAALPPILDGRHTLLIAPTGMGKTESALIPILDRLVQVKADAGEVGEETLAEPDADATERSAAGTRRVVTHRPAPGVRVVYVTPLRALNRDLMGRLESWGKALGLDVAVRHGDTPQSERNRQSRRPPDVLITTPETLQVMLLGKRLREHLRWVRWVVVDEVHELAADERGAQLAVALERVAALVLEARRREAVVRGDDPRAAVRGEAFQRVGLSATVGDPREVAAFLGGADRSVDVVKVPVAKALDLLVERPVPDQRARDVAAQLMCRPDAAAQLLRCLDLVKEHTSTLLFVNTRETAEVLTARVRMLDPEFPLEVHHGSLSVESRIAAEEAFKQGRLRALVCTSSMELGIDIGSADLVIQYTSPRQATRLVQRVGRAGHRADLVSNGRIIATDPDDVAEAAVIVRRTLDEHIERAPPHDAPLDVLANQLAAIAQERGELNADDVFRLFRRAHPFRHLDRDVFDEVLAQVEEHWLLWREDAGGEDERLGPKRRTRRYFLENISMIPDTRTYRVVSIVTNRSVATLDESFVASFIEPGATFIAQGTPWRVAEVDHDDALLRVEPVKDPLGAVPSWVGEEIPVPWHVAQDVGRLRARVRDLLQDAQEAVGAPLAAGEVGVVGDDDEARDRLIAARAAEVRRRAAAALSEESPLDAGAAEAVVASVDEQRGYALPTHDVVTIETGGGHCVINVCGGHRVNEALGRVLSSLLSARTGTSVGLQVDPYRVILTLPARATGTHVEELLVDTDPAALPALMELVLTSSSYLRYKLVHVARKFGALSREMDHRKVSVNRLLDVYKGTPLYRETLREVLHDRLDVAGAQRVLRDLREGRTRLVVQGLSPLGAAGLDQRVELISPARANRTLLEALERRLQGEEIMLLCMHCRDWSTRTRVARAARLRTCPACGGRLLAATRPWNEAGLAAWRKAAAGEPLTQAEKNEYRRLVTSANLVFDHGERALMALVGRGIGPDTAGRLLQRQRGEDEDAFLRDVLEGEITYARTRAFWD